MEITTLPSGQVPPTDKDCISIVERDDGLFELTGAALVACPNGGEAQSVALIGLPPFKSREEAENVGLAWAAQQCVDHLYVTDVEYSIAR
ncbi:hypothetical protein [Sphingomonas sp. 3-13AW]|jgi:hypothetical protein|uniref:hypothetical protein n=1 Tax=Sphingomonas sp. 3-13AW TaxID=3050450 RepID=UPI003BB4C3B6